MQPRLIVVLPIGYFYANNVDYYSNGVISRDKVVAFIGDFALRWPIRKYILKGRLIISPECDSTKKEVKLFYTVHRAGRQDKEFKRILKLIKIGGKILMYPLKKAG